MGVSTRSVELQTDSGLYRVSYDASDWSGSVAAFRCNGFDAASGDINATRFREAAEKIANQGWDSGRRIVPMRSNLDSEAPVILGGGPFRWATLSVEQQAALGTSDVLEWCAASRTWPACGSAATTRPTPSARRPSATQGMQVVAFAAQPAPATGADRRSPPAASAALAGGAIELRVAVRVDATGRRIALEVDTGELPLEVAARLARGVEAAFEDVAFMAARRDGRPVRAAIRWSVALDPRAPIALGFRLQN